MEPLLHWGAISIIPRKDIRPAEFRALDSQLRYIYDRTVEIFQMEPPMLGSAGMSLLPPPKLIASCTMGEIDDSFDLVECDSKVLVVFSKFTQRYSSNNILVYRLDDLILDRVVP